MSKKLHGKQQSKSFDGGVFTLHYSEITNIILKKNIKPTIGATPKKTVYTSLKRMLKNKEANISMIETGIFIYKKRP